MNRYFRSALLAAILLGSSAALNADIRVSADEAMKAALKKTPPEYPPIARQMKVSGRVEVEVVIDTDGSVESVKVISGNAMLTPAVVNSLKHWKFTPFTQGGSPAKAVATLGFDFKY